MGWSIAADLLVLLHLAFIIFVLFGGLLVWRWSRVIFLHLPAVAWGALLEFNGWICPLTPLEQQLRLAAGETGYESGFISHYILPVLYPQGLTLNIQVWLGVFVLVLNAIIYGWLILSKRLILK